MIWYHTICLSWTVYKMCNPPKCRALVYARELFDICWSSCFQWPLSVFWLTLLRPLSVPSNPNRDTQLNPNSRKRKRISLPDMRDTHRYTKYHVHTLRSTMSNKCAVDLTKKWYQPFLCSAVAKDTVKPKLMAPCGWNAKTVRSCGSRK